MKESHPIQSPRTYCSFCSTHPLHPTPDLCPKAVCLDLHSYIYIPLLLLFFLKLLCEDCPFPLTSFLLPLVEEVEHHRAHGDRQPHALRQVHLVAVDQDGRQQSHDFSRQPCGSNPGLVMTVGGGAEVTTSLELV